MSQRPEIEKKMRKEGGSARSSPSQYLLFPFLLFSVFFFAVSRFFPPCRGSPSSSRVFLAPFCFPPLQTVHNSTFDPVSEQQLLQAHMCAGRNNKVSQAGTMNQVIRKERLYQRGRRCEEEEGCTKWREWNDTMLKRVKRRDLQSYWRLPVVLVPDGLGECGLWVQQEAS